MTHSLRHYVDVTVLDWVLVSSLASCWLNNTNRKHDDSSEQLPKTSDCFPFVTGVGKGCHRRRAFVGRTWRQYIYHVTSWSFYRWTNNARTRKRIVHEAPCLQNSSREVKMPSLTLPLVFYHSTIPSFFTKYLLGRNIQATSTVDLSTH